MKKLGWTYQIEFVDSSGVLNTHFVCTRELAAVTVFRAVRKGYTVEIKLCGPNVTT